MNLNLIIEKKSLISFLTLFPLVVITTGIILYFMPRKSEVKYEYSEGKPWMSDMLIAEFDFDITRSAEDLENEKQKILQNYQPYFKRENAVEEETINNFLKAVEKDTTGILKSNKEDLVRNLHKIYEKGIIGKSVKEKWLADSVYNIKIINDNKEVTTDSLSAIPDVKEAYSILFSNDEQAKNKKKIEDFDLVRYVRPNIIYPEEYNENQKQLLLDEIPIKIGEVKKNQKIIGRGEIVNSTTCDIIRSYQEKQNENKASVNKRTMTSLWVAQSLYILIFVLLFTIYLSIFRPEYLKKKRKTEA